MLKITPALEELINSNWMLKFGLYHNIFNLTRLAKFIQPLIKTRTKKDVTLQSLIMALSRYQKSSRKKFSSQQFFSIKNFSLQSDLATLTYSNSQIIANQAHKLHAEIKKRNGFFSLSESTNEITLIIKKEYVNLAKKIIKENPKNEIDELSAIGIKFDSNYSQQPGFLYYIIQFISLQGINIIEISSTFTEVIIYVAEKDIHLALDTLIDGVKQNKNF